MKELSIKTKYRIGDTVWFADYIYDTVYPCEHAGKIEGIEITITDKGQRTFYRMSVDCGEYSRYEEHQECMCFGSYEECTKWCEARNKGDNNESTN